jgi:mannose-6-phosphate isomerase-like protein (cupin superfamily)
MDVDVDNIEFVFGVGGMDKKNSSSWILEEWKQPKTNRQWGYYRVLHDTPGCKVKELTVEPNKSLSMQKHKKRNEFWLVSEGSCVVYTKFEENGFHFPTELGKHQRYDISYNEWHKLTNPFDVPCKIIEIQYGEECIEEDIERE